MNIKDLVRTIPNYPKDGIMFRDITTLLEHPVGFRRTVDELVQPFAGSDITRVAGIEAVPLAGGRRRPSNSRHFQKMSVSKPPRSISSSVPM